MVNTNITAMFVDYFIRHVNINKNTLIPLPTNIRLAKKFVRFFFCKIKDTFFIFTNNYWFGYFEYLAIYHIVYNIDCFQLMSWFDCYQLQLVCPTMEHRPARNLQHETFVNNFWHIWLVTAPSPHTVQILFFASQLHFYFSWINKA